MNPVSLPLGALYVVKAGLVFTAIMLVVGYFLHHQPDHHPFAQLGLANQVTAVRAALVSLVAALIGEPTVPALAAGAVAASLLATILDGVDGWLARRTGMTSAFGARFDLEIDALLIQVLAILAWRHGKAGPWVVLAGLLRYLFVASGWLWRWMQRPLLGTTRGKAICIVQVGTLVAALVPTVTPPASTALAAIGLTALAYSFAVDTWWLWRTRDN